MTQQFQSIAPVFSSSNVSELLDHYRKLGFDVKPYADQGQYGYASRDGISIHFGLNPDHDPKTTAGCAYLYVQDADALSKEWSSVAGGRHVAPVDTEYGLREGAHIDPQGNLIRFGSPL